VSGEPAGWSAVLTISSALAPLRAGLTAKAARAALPRLRALLGTTAMALTAGTRLLAWDGPAEDRHGATVAELAAWTVETGHARAQAVPCGSRKCPVGYALTAPVIVGDRTAGVLLAFVGESSPTLLHATADLADGISGRLALAEVDRSRARLAEAELRTLHPRASPHFVFNSLTAIMSLIRTEPERAQDLLQEFSDVTRYTLQGAGFASLEAELRSIESYLALERVRFADRLNVTVRVAAEALPAAVPFLSLQALVDNAVRHGMERKTGPGHIDIAATPVGDEVHVSVEDDGVGMDPEQVRALLDRDDVETVEPGLGNVHQRLRRAFGDAYGLVIQARAGGGTRVTMRVPRAGAGR
jgi:two-component system, LytTR family, sensor kinase